MYPRLPAFATLQSCCSSWACILFWQMFVTTLFVTTRTCLVSFCCVACTAARISS